MQAQDAIRELLDRSRPLWSQNKLAAAVGLSPQAMVNRMSASDVKAGFLAECAEALGCRVVVVPPGTMDSDLPHGSIPIDPEKLEKPQPE